MSELYEDGSGNWNTSSQAQMKAPEETRSEQDNAIVFGQKSEAANATSHPADQGDENHHDLHSPKSSEQNAPLSPPKKQNPFF